MKIVDGKSNDRNEQDDGWAPLPSVRNKLILDSDPQKDYLKQYMIEQDCNLGAKDTQNNDEDDLMIESDIFEVCVLRWLDGGELMHHKVDNDAWEGAEETLQESAYHEIGRGKLHSKEDSTNGCSKSHHRAYANGCW